jgi:hypothetical protein
MLCDLAAPPVSRWCLNREISALHRLGGPTRRAIAWVDETFRVHFDAAVAAQASLKAGGRPPNIRQPTRPQSRKAALWASPGLGASSPLALLTRPVVALATTAPSITLAIRLSARAAVSYVSETNGTWCSVMTLNPQPSLCLYTARRVRHGLPPPAPSAPKAVHGA